MDILHLNGASASDIALWQDVEDALARAPEVRLALYAHIDLIQSGKGGALGKRKLQSIGAQNADFANDEALSILPG
jgi:hypothetical protein